jgi:large subunit ribosomal protein L23
MSIIIKPVITEKMTAASEKLGRYGFWVEKSSNKIQIRKAVEEMYGVKVDAVKTMNILGKMKFRNTTKGMSQGREASLKKAVVYLAKGETIDFYSNI